MGRAGPDPAGLHLVEHEHPVSGYRRAAARCGHRAGDRRRLCRTCSRRRARPGIVADARDRPDVLLVVPVALAGADVRPAPAGPPAGAGRQAGSGPDLRRAGRAHPASPREPVAIRRPVRRSAWRSLALGGAATAVAVCVGVALLVVVPTPVGRGAPATPLTLTAAPSPRARTSTPTTRRCSTRSRRCRPRSRPRPTSKPSRRTSTRRLPTRQPKTTPFVSTAACAHLGKSSSLSARPAIPPRRRRSPWSATRMPRCGIRRSSRSPSSGAGGWRS